MEVEVKVKLDELEPVRKKLAERGASFDEPVTHQDVYFKTMGFEKRVQGPGEFIVRIRKIGRKSLLTFKALTEIRGAWIEHETHIDDPEEMEKILLSIGMVRAFTLNKTRVMGELDGFELCLDNVKELGKYMEVCLISDQKEEPRNKIIEFLKGLGFSDKDIDPRGYGELIGEKLGHRFDGMR